MHFTSFLLADPSSWFIAEVSKLSTFFESIPHQYRSYEFIPTNLYIPYRELLNDFPVPSLLTYIKKLWRTWANLNCLYNLNDYALTLRQRCRKVDFLVMKETEYLKENPDICNENIKLRDKSTELSREMNYI